MDQEHLLNNYITWCYKSPIYDGMDFHIAGLKNSLQAMQDGVITYMGLCPHCVIGAVLYEGPPWGAEGPNGYVPLSHRR